MKEGEEVASGFVVAGGDASTPFELREHPRLLHQRRTLDTFTRVSTSGFNCRKRVSAASRVTFDTPILFIAMGHRNVSNVPAQAIILLNDPLVVDHSRRWVSVVMFDVTTQGVFQMRRAGKDTQSQPLLGEVAEPPFDHIQPRTGGRREVQVKLWMSFEPRLDIGVFMRRVVVEDQMQIEVRRSLGINVLQKRQPCMMPLSWQTVGDDFSLRQFQRS